MVALDEVVALCKRRGFIYPGSEIYGGIAGFWDYGPLGVELKRNIKEAWWKDMVYGRDDIVGLDASIIMNPQVWVASGHTEGFADPLVECKICHKRIKADDEKLVDAHEKEHDAAVSWTEPKTFNLLTEVYLGVTEPKEKAYLRGEITQGVFVNFQNIVNSSRVKIPFGVAQIGKAFRNEITPGNFTFRSREFEQMELEFFVKPDEEDSKKTFEYWKRERINWYKKLGIKAENLRFKDHDKDQLVHYARYATDIQYNAPFGWSELEGIHHRGDWDLGRHKLTYKDQLSGEEYTPWVIETSGGVDRAALFFLIDAYSKGKDRVILKLHPKLAPYKAAVFPLLANKPDLLKKAKDIYNMLNAKHHTAWDDRGNIGKRYAAQDEIGTPWCITVDFDTIQDDTVTIRDRDTSKQERVSVDKILEYIQNRLQG